MKGKETEVSFVSRLNVNNQRTRIRLGIVSNYWAIQWLPPAPPSPWGLGGCVPAVVCSSIFFTTGHGDEGQGQTPKRVSRTEHKEKVANAVPSANSCSRFGAMEEMYPIHFPITSNNRLMSLRLPETCSARLFRSLPGRTWVGLFVRTGTSPPRNVITICTKKGYRRFSCLSFAVQATQLKVGGSFTYLSPRCRPLSSWIPTAIGSSLCREGQLPSVGRLVSSLSASLSAVGPSTG